MAEWENPDGFGFGGRALGTHKDSTSLIRDEFIQELEAFVARWNAKPSFAGKTSALRALRRIPNLSALRK
jgi:hypothetical protein